MFDFEEIDQATKQRNPLGIKLEPPTAAPITPYKPVETVQGEIIDPPARPTTSGNVGGTGTPTQTRSGTAWHRSGSFDRPTPAPKNPNPSANPGGGYSGAGGVGAAGIGGAVAGGLGGGIGGAIAGAGAGIGGAVGGSLGAGAGGVAGALAGSGGAAAGATAGGMIGGSIGAWAGGAIGGGIAGALGFGNPASNVPSGYTPARPGGGTGNGTAIAITFYSPNNNRHVTAIVFSYQIRAMDNPYTMPSGYPVTHSIDWVVADCTPSGYRARDPDENAAAIDPATLEVGIAPACPILEPDPNPSPDPFPFGWTEFHPPVLAPPPPTPDVRPFPVVRPPVVNPRPTANPAPTPPPNPAPFPVPFPFPAPFPPPIPLPPPNPGPGSGTGTGTGTGTGGQDRRIPDPLPQPQPQPQPDPRPWSPPPPPPPPERKPNLCDDPCIVDLGRKLDELLEKPECEEPEPIEISVKVFDKCTEDGPEFKTQNVQVLPGNESAVQLLFEEVAELQALQCRPKEDCVAAIPDWWQIRLGADIPQLVVQYAERVGEKDGKPKYGAPKYIITIPHYRLSFDATTKALFPSYTKGSRMGVFICNDNSKLIVNAENEAEVNRVINQLQSLIVPAFTEGARINNGDRRGTDLKTITVYPRIAKYFAQGQKDLKPTWIKHFSDE